MCVCVCQRKFRCRSQKRKKYFKMKSPQRNLYFLRFCIYIYIYKLF